MKKFLSVLSAFFFALTLAACASSPNSRATGQVLDDAAITARVKTEIAQVAGLGEAASINVDTYRGVVSLAGFVNNTEQVQSAVQAARRVPGVTEVKNNLQIKPRS